nr:cytochrome c oxidase subunit 7C; mitochondrial-like isoform X4 [Biomphalaria glabrata]
MSLSQVSRLFVRQFKTSTVSRSQGWQQEGIPGSNLPFDIRNKTKLTIYFITVYQVNDTITQLRSKNTFRA